MLRSVGMRVTALAALSFALIGGLAPAASAQQDAAAKLLDRHVTVQFESARMGQVLRALMGTLGANYVVDSEIKDSLVTANLADVTLRVALDAITRIGSAPVSYSIEDGIFYFTPRRNDRDVVSAQVEPPAAPASARKPEQKVVSIPVMFSDPGEIALLLGGSVAQVSYQSFGLLGFGGGAGRGGQPGAGGPNGSNPGGAGLNGFGGTPTVLTGPGSIGSTGAGFQPFGAGNGPLGGRR